MLELSFVYLAVLLGMGRTDAFSIALVAEAMVLLSLLPGALAYLFPSPAGRGSPPGSSKPIEEPSA